MFLRKTVEAVEKSKVSNDECSSLPLFSHVSKNVFA